MGRWQPDAQGRLQQAALTLFAKQGFESTTVAEIAEQAGLTKRTFFRYFADKREVLFQGADELKQLFVTEVADASLQAEPHEPQPALTPAPAPSPDARYRIAAGK